MQLDLQDQLAGNVQLAMKVLTVQFAKMVTSYKQVHATPAHWQSALNALPAATPRFALPARLGTVETFVNCALSDTTLHQRDRSSALLAQQSTFTATNALTELIAQSAPSATPLPHAPTVL